MKYYSISRYPGTTGYFYYNYFFKKYKINAEYIPLGCEPINFYKLLNDLLEKNDTCGINFSMPYKNSILNYFSKSNITYHESVSKYEACNTFNVKSMTLYNCDLFGIEKISKNIKSDDRISILGYGSMSKMFYGYLTENKYKNPNIYSRKTNNWEDRHSQCDVIINCTSFGTVNSESPIHNLPKDVSLVVDLAIKPGNLYHQSQLKNVNYISGLKFYHYQFIEQFKCYTNIELNYNEVVKAKQND